MLPGMAWLEASALLPMPGLPCSHGPGQDPLWLIGIESLAYSPPPPELLSKYLPSPSHEPGPVRAMEPNNGKSHSLH